MNNIRGDGGSKSHKGSKHVEDRREFPRLYPNSKNQPRVTFTFKGNIKVAINTLNISKGGLMGYTSSIEHFLGIEDQNIKQIEIVFPKKGPFRCPGRILRLQPVLNENRCYCAVEFILEEVETDEDEPHEEVKASDDVVEFVPDSVYLDRVKALAKYNDLEDVDHEANLRDRAYHEFADIANHLTTEEQWLFFELLDEMKTREPNYPEELKRAFLKLCHTGAKQSKNKRPKLLQKQNISRQMGR